MSKKLLAGPYLIWMIGFTIIPLALVVYYGLTDRTGAFTLENILAIATAEHAKALWLSLGLSLAATVIGLLLDFPLALIIVLLRPVATSVSVLVFVFCIWLYFLFSPL